MMANNNGSSVSTSIHYKLLSAFLAFLMWGGWAFFINAGHGMKTQIISSLGQGTASFIITLFMIRLVTYIFHKLPEVKMLRLLIPAVLTVGLTGTCLVAMHICIGTPNIASTVAPALSVAFLFCVYTSFKINKIKMETVYE